MLLYTTLLFSKHWLPTNSQAVFGENQKLIVAHLKGLRFLLYAFPSIK